MYLMKIGRIQIKNFKSIKSIKFAPRDINVFVGENDSGKTNILRALELFFDPTKRPNEADKNYNVMSNQIEIEVEFSSLRDDWKRTLAEGQHITGDSAKIKRIYNFKSENGKYLDYKGKKIDRSKIISLFRNMFLYVPVLRDIKAELSGDTSIVYRQMVRNLLLGMTKYRQGTFRSAIKDAVGRLDRYLNQELSQVNSVFNELIPDRKASLTVTPTIEDIVNELKVRFGNDHSDLSIFHKGQGLQSLAIIGLYKASAEQGQTTTPFLAIEEPELHLHPHLINNFLNNIFAMSKRAQIFLTTHSSVVLNKCKLEDIFRVEAVKNFTEVRGFRGGGSLDISEARSKINVDKAQIFFAKKVVLSEGITERNILPELSTKLEDKYSFYKNGISVMEVDGGVFNIYIRLLKCYRIPYIILCDFHCWKSGGLQKVIREMKLNRKFPRIFNRLANGNPQKQEIHTQLKRFGCICLKDSMDELLLTCDNRAISKILKEAVPGRYKASAKNRRHASEDELKEIMKAKKGIWSIAIGRHLEPEKISQELKDIVKDIVTITPNR